MRIGIRVAVSLLVGLSIGASTLVVQALWWGTAQQNSRQLAAEINSQIAYAVRNEVDDLLHSAQAAWDAIHTVFIQNVIQTREADKREFVFLSQLQAQRHLSWIVFGWPDGDFFAAHRLGDGGLEMVEIDDAIENRAKRTDRYDFIPGDIMFRERNFTPTDYDPRNDAWYAKFIDAQGTGWVEAPGLPGSRGTAFAYAGPIDVYTHRQGVLAVVIELDRLSRFLGQLHPGRFGAVFVLDSEGNVIAAPDAKADEVTPAKVTEGPLYQVAKKAGEQLMGAHSIGGTQGTSDRIVLVDTPYAVNFTPLDFYGWQVLTVIPEAAFLGPIDQTLRRQVLLVGGIVALAMLIAIWLGRKLLATPFARIVEDLRRVERFDVDLIRRRPSMLAELADLSAATASMASGLSAFRKYLPADLVRTLVAEGIETRPGGEIREISVMFCDVAGFTGLSERLGTAVVPLMEVYFQAAARAIGRHEGTIDKFIGDAVMAFWGAPRRDPAHAVNACRAALDIVGQVAAADIRDDTGAPLRIRIGINSGEALVGNIGSPERLNYTAMGDVVNVASRLEGASKIYGTAVLIGPATRAAAGAAILAREVDSLAVLGRREGLAIHELIAMTEQGVEAPGWIALYEEGLTHYRSRRFAAAVGAFAAADEAREGGDLPARLMKARAESYRKVPPPEDWAGVALADSK